jgi:hypothetical protein
MITSETRASETPASETPASVRAEATTMKAVVQDRYGSAGVLALRDIAKPEIGDGDVLVRVRAAGVNPADWAIVGGLPYIARPMYGWAGQRTRFEAPTWQGRLRPSARA